MTVDRKELIKEFWEAPNEALFDQKTVAAVSCRSIYWCENLRCEGGGIPFIKDRKKCLYRKIDVVEWLNQYKTVKSTSEYKQPANCPKKYEKQEQNYRSLFSFCIIIHLWEEGDNQILGLLYLVTRLGFHSEIKAHFSRQLD